jgi:selenide, water dikinase
MLPGYLAGHYDLDACHIDLRVLCGFAGARFYRTAAIGLDTENHVLKCADRPDVAYDFLSFDIGSSPRQSEIEGAERCISVKPVDRFLTRWEHVEHQAIEAGGNFKVVVIGAGAGGTEAAMALQHRLTTVLKEKGVGSNNLSFAIVGAAGDPLPDHSAPVRRSMRRSLEDAGIPFYGSHRVISVGESVLRCDPKLDVSFDAAVLITPAAAPRWLNETSLKLDEDGFICVGDTLQTVSASNIFATGDVAAFTPRPLLKSGVYAVRQGPVLADNLRRMSLGGEPKPFRPQRRALALISQGGKRAVASWGPFAHTGASMWKLKDWIDRRWMRKYQELPDMESAPPPPSAEPVEMRCGGCGAKVPGDVLARVLAGLNHNAAGGNNPTVWLGLDAPDDAAVLRPEPGKLLVQTVDQFRTFIDDPYLFGKITANHCLGDLYAMGAQPSTVLASIAMPYAPDTKLEQDLKDLLTGALEVLNQAGASLIGGHTGEGAELNLGLTINGYVEEEEILRKSGMMAGDALILTKPLGTGAILAADMRGKGRGGWTDGALEMMSVSNQQAASILRASDVTACTDVTGFGLAGHLGEMLAASNASAEISVGDIPKLPGASELLSKGTASTLHPANHRSSAPLVDGQNPADILFDPQTAGGLLASVPSRNAGDCLDALHSAGYHTAAIIGIVTERDEATPSISLV